MVQIGANQIPEQSDMKSQNGQAHAVPHDEIAELTQVMLGKRLRVSLSKPENHFYNTFPS